jgi:hypothetical protein
MFIKFFLMLGLLAAMGHSIGYQHGTFQSQSTQGKSWTGTASITNEHFNITVHRQYLDVELEWVFGVGGQAPEEHRDALEIVGNLNLEQGSIVIGMLLWYKDELLKAKLKRKEVARKQYEEVVDRNAAVPPRPRDPVIFEYGWGPDNYDISIFPVVWDGSRKLRLRYLIPRGNRYDANSFGFPHAFTSTATAILRKGKDISGFSILGYDTTVDIQKDTIVLSGAELEPYGSNSINYIRPWVTPNTSASLTKNAPTKMCFAPLELGGVQGELTRFSDFNVGHILASIKDSLPVDSNKQLNVRFGVFAIISNGAEKCSTGVKLNNISNIDKLTDSLAWTRDLIIFSSKSLRKEIQWHIYLNGEHWKTIVEQPAEEALNDAILTGCVAAKSGRLMSLDTKVPKSLAAAFGFVDTAFALLALETDQLPVTFKGDYADAGVPLLNREDIFADTADMVPGLETPLFQENAFNIPLKVKLEKADIDIFSNFIMKVAGGMLAISFDGITLLEDQRIEVAIFTLAGKMLRKEIVKASNGCRELRIPLGEAYPRTVVVHVNAGNFKIARILNTGRH